MQGEILGQESDGKSLLLLFPFDPLYRLRNDGLGMKGLGCLSMDSSGTESRPEGLGEYFAHT
jgi:hypothetical protein